MRSWSAQGALLVAIVVVAAVGLLDSLFVEEHDFAVLFALEAVMAATGVVLWIAGRRALRVEPDLAHWLRTRSERTGEPADRIADRALSRYRHDLDGGPAGGHDSGEP